MRLMGNIPVGTHCGYGNKFVSRRKTQGLFWLHETLLSFHGPYITKRVTLLEGSDRPSYCSAHHRLKAYQEAK